MTQLQPMENEKKTFDMPVGWSKKAVSLTGMTLFSLGALLGFFGGWFIGRMQTGLSPIPAPIETIEPDIVIPYASPSPIIIGPTEPGGVPSVPPDGMGVACTMDAMLCPDGSSVGRQPPSCQFAPCPGSGSSSGNSGSGTVITSPGYDAPVSTTAPQAR